MLYLAQFKISGAVTTCKTKILGFFLSTKTRENVTLLKIHIFKIGYQFFCEKQVISNVKINVLPLFREIFIEMCSSIVLFLLMSPYFRLQLDLKSVLPLPTEISPWTPLKPKHNNPNPNPLANQLWSIDFLTPPTPLIIPNRLFAFLESLMPLKNWCSVHARCSKSSLKPLIRFCGIIFSKFKTQLYNISFF